MPGLHGYLGSLAGGDRIGASIKMWGGGGASSTPEKLPACLALACVMAAVSEGTLCWSVQRVCRAGRHRGHGGFLSERSARHGPGYLDEALRRESQKLCGYSA